MTDHTDVHLYGGSVGINEIELNMFLNLLTYTNFHKVLK